MMTREDFVAAVAGYFMVLPQSGATYSWQTPPPRVKKAQIARYTIPQVFEPGWRVDHPHFNRPTNFSEIDLRRALSVSTWEGGDLVRWGPREDWWLLPATVTP